MRVWLTGGSGFVGSNLRHVFAERGAEVVAPAHADVDLTDGEAVRRAVEAAAPDAIVHCAIWNDPAGLDADRRRAWAAYVGATRNVVGAAGGTHVVLVSTDWVFDGDGGPFAEDDPPRPTTTYGFLKAASELVVTERAACGTVARIAAVQGVHRARPQAPREQDAGFGYLALSVAQALSAGREFAVWDGPGLNERATPTLATDAGELIWRALERRVTGVLHCCGGEHTDRLGLARRAAVAFGLDPGRIVTGPPPAGSVPVGVPADTRLDARATAAALGADLPTLDDALARLAA